MKKQKISEIAAQFSAYNVQFSDTGEGFEIINPYSEGKEPIIVMDEGREPYTAYVVSFSYFHTHPDMAEQVIAWVRDILEGRRFVIAFFKEDRWAGSTTLEEQQLHELTYETLAKHMGWDGITKPPYGDPVRLIDKADSFIIRGWGKDADFDGKFIKDAQGNVSIQAFRKS
ncbi:MAG: hypothetical protein IJW40_11565 [Clostridia bacterium]|nr:hypothetical protein [Clostridia bacterium]